MTTHQEDYARSSQGPPAGEGLAAKDIEELFAAGQKETAAARHAYWMNHAYLMGEQWLFFNSAANRVDHVTPVKDRIQVTVNRMLPASRTVIAKAVSRPLQWYVPPRAADDASLRGARTAESAVRHAAREHNWEGLREDSLWATWKGGTAAICTHWDPEAGTILGRTNDDEAYGTGDTVERVLSVADFVVEPGSADGERARWWIESVALPPGVVKDMLGLDKEPEADATAALTPFQRKLVASHTGTDVNIPLTRVLTYWERPNPSRKDGLVAYVVTGKIYKRASWPFPFKDRLNLVLMRETRVENQWYGTTVLNTARPIQNAINQSWSNLVEHLRNAGQARLAVPQSNVDFVDQLTDTPGEVVTYPDGTEPPRYISPAILSQWVLDQPMKLREELDDALSVHEVSRGEAPGRVDSALGISILVEQDSTPGGRLVKEQALMFGRLGELLLRQYEANVKETRESVVTTPGQPPRAVRWSGKDLRGQVEVEVPLDQVMPRNRAAQQAMADNMVTNKLITSVEQWFKVAQIPLDADLLEALSPDVALARRENAMMALGRMQVTEPFHDHNQHIPEHHTYMKSEEWSYMDEQYREMFRIHVNAHATLAAEQLGKQLAKAEVNPVLASAADATGAPVLPLTATGPAAAGAGPAGGAVPDVAGAVQAQNPGIPPDQVQQGVSGELGGAPAGPPAQ